MSTIATDSAETPDAGAVTLVGIEALVRSLKSSELLGHQWLDADMRRVEKFMLAEVHAVEIRAARSTAVAPGVPAGVVRDYLAAVDVRPDTQKGAPAYAEARVAADRKIVKARDNLRTALLAALASSQADAGGDFPDNCDIHAAYSSAVMSYWSDSTLANQNQDRAHALGLEAVAAVARRASAAPAGGVPGVEAIAEALFYTAEWTNKDIVWSEIAEDKATITQGVVRGLRKRAAAIHARLAAAGTGDEGRAST